MTMKMGDTEKRTTKNQKGIRMTKVQKVTGQQKAEAGGCFPALIRRQKVTELCKKRKKIKVENRGKV